MTMVAVERVLWAVVVLLVYAGFCLGLYLRRRAARQRALKEAAALVPAASGTLPVLVAYASQTVLPKDGLATARVLHTAGAGRAAPAGEVTAEELQRFERALFIASTYGEGDRPTRRPRLHGAPWPKRPVSPR